MNIDELIKLHEATKLNDRAFAIMCAILSNQSVDPLRSCTYNVKNYGEALVKYSFTIAEQFQKEVSNRGKEGGLL